MIHFIQYLRPDGRTKIIEVDRPKEIEDIAHRFIKAGGYFEVELLTDEKTVSLTAGFDRSQPDIVVILEENGPKVPAAVDQLVRRSWEWYNDSRSDG